ncbi:MAG: ATP-binding protein [Deltaproteobacteria bacterium]|jgi:anti-sigma regulatory factor (Ser/Thr protein kinase)|nr:ATP-binding protein [Deltaproteobacteria bacterium]
MMENRVFHSLRELPDLLDLAENVCRRADLPESTAFRAQVVLEELFVNIFKHAYQDGDGPAEITLEAAPEGIWLRVADQGPAFDPLNHKTPDLQKRFEQGVPGGAGLVLLRSMAQELRYSRLADKNILEMRINRV